MDQEPQEKPAQRKPGTWAPGQSGNPLGRPKGSLSVQEALIRALSQKWIVPEGEEGAGEVRTKLDQMARAMVAQAISGSVPAAQWVGDRLEGRVASKVEISGGVERQVVVVPWRPATQAAIDAAQTRGQVGQLPPGSPGGPATAAETVLPGEVEVLNHDLVERAVDVE